MGVIGVDVGLTGKLSKAPKGGSRPPPPKNFSHRIVSPVIL